MGSGGGGGAVSSLDYTHFTAVCVINFDSNGKHLLLLHFSVITQSVHLPKEVFAATITLHETELKRICLEENFTGGQEMLILQVKTT